MPRDRHGLGHELVDASPSETTPTLLALARRQAERRRPRDLLVQWERDAYVAPSMLDGRTMHALDGLALEAAEGYEALVLSPVAPLGRRVLLNVRTAEGDVVPLGDVGRFDWVARLTANRRMRMVAAGFGVQLLPLRFRDGLHGPGASDPR